MARAVRKPTVHYREYECLDGLTRTLISKVSNGSIITRFEKTPIPRRETDVVCPHFLELKWAYGCPFDCAWCYLQGTFRFIPGGIPPPVVKPYDKTQRHVERFLEEVEEPEILNAGEIGDSLMNENAEVPFSKFIIPVFEKQARQVLFVTKSPNVKNLLEMGPHNQAIISFSLNAIPVAERWERAPGVLKRIEAAKKVSNAGYEVRLRIDPMVPVENWQEHYLRLLEIIFENLTPERITLGSLRGLASTIGQCTDKSWVAYLKEPSNWGKKIDFGIRYAMYSMLIQELHTTYHFDTVALCKETLQIWDAFKMDYREIRCNCVW